MRSLVVLISLIAGIVSGLVVFPRVVRPGDDWPQNGPTKANPFVVGARNQLSWHTTYNSAYVRIPYPQGDVPKKYGVCTDVLVRALRHGGVDLQALIHEDIRDHWDKYPRYPNVRQPDANIDHRRVPNHRVFMRRHAVTLGNDRDWLPGDLVYWKLDNGLDHCGVVTDQRGSSGNLMVIHNLSTPAEEDCLKSWKVTDHFRVVSRRR